jgi:hypothetical protein
MSLQLSAGNVTLAALLQSGFAFATTSFARDGYAIEQGAEDIDQLLRVLQENVRRAWVTQENLPGRRF